MSTRGRHLWYDLMTTDVQAAKAFYTETIGWKTQPFEGGDYTMFVVGEEPMGGVMQLPDEAKQAGAPPHWMAYIGVEDVDAACGKIEVLGGKVFKGGTDIPNVGRFAVVADPQGAPFGVFTPAGEMPGHDEMRAGDVTWHELNTTDRDAAWKFYSELLGWKQTDTFDMGPELGSYLMFQHEGATRTIGGMSNAAKVQGFPPHWLYYVMVDDLDAALKRAQDNGGKLIHGPMEVPGGDTVAQCCDPQGAAFALHMAKK